MGIHHSGVNMAIISGGKVIGGYGPYSSAGAPTAGTSMVQTITVNGAPTGGTYKLSRDGVYTSAIAYDAAAAAVQTALQALPQVGAGGAQATGSAGGPYTVTASGANAKQVLTPFALAVNSLVGGTAPTVVVATTTPGVDVTGVGAEIGATLRDTTNGIAYINTGTAAVPVWAKVGTQT